MKVRWLIVLALAASGSAAALKLMDAYHQAGGSDAGDDQPLWAAFLDELAFDEEVAELEAAEVV